MIFQKHRNISHFQGVCPKGLIIIVMNHDPSREKAVQALGTSDNIDPLYPLLNRRSRRGSPLPTRKKQRQEGLGVIRLLSNQSDWNRKAPLKRLERNMATRLVGFTRRSISISLVRRATCARQPIDHAATRTETRKGRFMAVVNGGEGEVGAKKLFLLMPSERRGDDPKGYIWQMEEAVALEASEAFGAFSTREHGAYTP
uniref:Uncharacterized protein n=1 Tax=Steinernema glaseri TaxID=37863 RepID=A0A1I7Y0U9_9BILA